MLIGIMRRLSVFVFAAGTVLITSPLWAQPPALDIPPAALRGGLQPTHLSQLDARINYWLSSLQQTDDSKKIVEIRDKLLADYRLYDSNEYRYSFAARAAQLAMPVIEADMPLKQLKQVNLGLAISQMSQVTIQPILEKMIVSKNPALRYIGWGGYRRARMLLMAQGMGFSKQMFASLAKRSMEEKSAPVVGAIFQMLQIPIVPPATVRTDALRQGRLKSFAIGQKMWPVRGKEVMDGSAAMAGACRKGIRALENLAATATDGQDIRNKAVQMIVDMAWFSAKAYDGAKAAGAVGQANSQLMRDCERALNGMTKRRKVYIQTPLTEPRIADRGAAVRLGVLKWAEELEDLGVEKPTARNTP